MTHVLQNSKRAYGASLWDKDMLFVTFLVHKLLLLASTM